MGTQQPNPNQFNNRFTGQEMSVHINFFAHCQTGQIDNHMVLSGHKILEGLCRPIPRTKQPSRCRAISNFDFHCKLRGSPMEAVPMKIIQTLVQWTVKDKLRVHIKKVYIQIRVTYHGKPPCDPSSGASTAWKNSSCWWAARQNHAEIIAAARRFTLPSPGSQSLWPLHGPGPWAICRHSPGWGEYI